MKIKNQKGFTGIDALVAIVAIMLFSGLIASMMFTNFMENLKVKKEALAIIYLTETLENIGIADFDNVNSNNVDEFIPQDAIEDNYEIILEIVGENDNTVITKKVKATIFYSIDNKKYQHSMERIKVKE